MEDIGEISLLKCTENTSGLLPFESSAPLKIFPEAFYSLGFVLGERGTYEEESALKFSGSVTLFSLILFLKYIS